ncbi:MAG: mannose-6-phosphate isomerase, class I [Melioribacteraceae bacterium]|nr:mannose-6-phosphate isomerase, class I [Melioribacteraceae bacterium]
MSEIKIDMLEKKPYILYNSIQHYEWGTIGKDAFIPNLLDFPAKDMPYAELWIGAHPKLSSKLEINDELVKLQTAINDYPIEILGERVSKKFDGKLPFLLKILSARKALSIQTHPNKEQAKKLHESDPVNYPDNNHKPEIAIVLTTLDALIGFRSPNKILENLKQYPSLKEYLGDEVTNDFELSLESGTDPTKLIENIFIKLVLKTSDDFDLKKCIDSISESIGHKDIRSKDEDLFIELKSEYSYDIGLLTLFFLNHIQLNEGDAIFTNAGVPHAYLKGDIVECMANSDNVVRAGLTPKFKDVNTLLNILDYEGSDSMIHSKKINEYIKKYSPPIAEFQIEKIELNNNGIELATKDQVEVLLITKGNVNIYISDGLDEILTFASGETALIPAVVDKYMIYSEDDSHVFRVTIP